MLLKIESVRGLREQSLGCSLIVFLVVISKPVEAQNSVVSYTDHPWFAALRCTLPPASTATQKQEDVEAFEAVRHGQTEETPYFRLHGHLKEDFLVLKVAVDRNLLLPDEHVVVWALGRPLVATTCSSLAPITFALRLKDVPFDTQDTMIYATLSRCSSFPEEQADDPLEVSMVSKLLLPLSRWLPQIRMYEESKDGAGSHLFHCLPKPAASALFGVDSLSSHAVAEGSDRVVLTGHGGPALEFTPRVGSDVIIKQCEFGLMIIPQVDALTQLLREFGVWSTASVDLFRVLIAPGETVLDVGANVGVFTVLFGQLVGPRGRVFAFEPLRATFQVLNANIVLNDLDNVRAFNLVLGAEAKGGTTLVPQRASNPFQFNAKTYEDHAPDRAMQLVDKDSIDSIFKDVWDPPADENSTCVHLLKIDAEGMDTEVLAGAAAVIAHCTPVLFYESGLVGVDDNTTNWLRSLGYQLFYHSYQAAQVLSESFEGWGIHVGIDPMKAESLIDVETNIVAIPPWKLGLMPKAQFLFPL